MNSSFISHIDLNPRRRDARKLLGSPNAMHAAVEASFPPIADATGRVLWRLDRSEVRSQLYVVSPRKPDFTHIIEQAGWPSSEQNWLTKDYLPLLNSLSEGQVWEYRLTANPVHQSRKEGDGGKRFGHVTVDQQTAWLRDREKRLGFRMLRDREEQLLSAVIRRERSQFYRRSANGTGSKVTISRVTFQGMLEIIDPDVFRQSMTRGIGHAKAYGCGLITLANPSRKTQDEQA